MDAASMCQPGQSLMVRLQAVNRDDGVELYGPWSSEVEYPCLREGIRDVRVHVTVEIVHTFRFEMLPPLPYAMAGPWLVSPNVYPSVLPRLGSGPTPWPWPAVRHQHRHHVRRDRNYSGLIGELARRRFTAKSGAGTP